MIKLFTIMSTLSSSLSRPSVHWYADMLPSYSENLRLFSAINRWAVMTVNYGKDKESFPSFCSSDEARSDLGSMGSDPNVSNPQTPKPQTPNAKHHYKMYGVRSILARFWVLSGQQTWSSWVGVQFKSSMWMFLLQKYNIRGNSSERISPWTIPERRAMQL